MGRSSQYQLNGEDTTHIEVLQYIVWLLAYLHERAMWRTMCSRLLSVTVVTLFVATPHCPSIVAQDVSVPGDWEVRCLHFFNSLVLKHPLQKPTSNISLSARKALGDRAVGVLTPFLNANTGTVEGKSTFYVCPHFTLRRPRI